MASQKQLSGLSVCFFGHSAGLEGAERSLLELTRELVQDHGIGCAVVLPENGPLGAALREAGSTVLVVPYHWWCSSDGPTATEIEERMEESRCAVVEGTKRDVRAFDPDVIVTHTAVVPWGALAASILRKPHVWNVCEYADPDPNLHFFLSFSTVREIVESTSNCVFFPSRSVRDTWFPDRRPHHHVLYRHVRLELHAVGAWQWPRLDGPDGSRTRLGVFGAIRKSKGQDTAVRAVSELLRRGRDVELLLAGNCDPAYLPSLEELLVEEGVEDRVHLAGFLDPVHPAMASTHIVLASSRAEAFGRVPVEAMLLEKPVVYSATGGHLETMIDDHTGLAYPPGDASRLADRVEELLRDPQKAERLARRGRAHALRRFTREEYGGLFARRLAAVRDAEPKSFAALERFVSTLSSGAASQGSHSRPVPPPVFAADSSDRSDPGTDSADPGSATGSPGGSGGGQRTPAGKPPADARSGWWSGAPGLLSYGHLLRNLVGRDLKLKYKGSVLGIAWSTVNPLLMLAVYTLAFRYIIRIDIENFSLFFFVGYLPWTFVANSLTASTTCILDNSALLQKIRFPRMVVPLSVVLSNAVQLILASMVVLPVLWWMEMPFTASLWLLPVILALHALFVLGLAATVAAAHTHFRDTRHFVEILLTLWFWTTPIVYTVDHVPEAVQPLWRLNPLAVYLDAYRAVTLEGLVPSASVFAGLAVCTTIALIVGSQVFRRAEARFPELV